MSLRNQNAQLASKQASTPSIIVVSLMNPVPLNAIVSLRKIFVANRLFVPTLGSPEALRKVIGEIVGRGYENLGLLSVFVTLHSPDRWINHRRKQSKRVTEYRASGNKQNLEKPGNNKNNKFLFKSRSNSNNNAITHLRAGWQERRPNSCPDHVARCTWDSSKCVKSELPQVVCTCPSHCSPNRPRVHRPTMTECIRYSNRNTFRGRAFLHFCSNPDKIIFYRRNSINWLPQMGEILHSLRDGTRVLLEC